MVRQIKKVSRNGSDLEPKFRFPDLDLQNNLRSGYGEKKWKEKKGKERREKKGEINQRQRKENIEDLEKPPEARGRRRESAGLLSFFFFFKKKKKNLR